eukprot:TRINITY_DN66671_c0_g1_i1.p1 TRINITY_DN66671_c0_g1~~TRINITY_DN66671_c0_g1_i1.p1  ORF type:complete len:228 (+),score=34.84 TRINITY_DN66671_c0_g1_i1:62-685(+)
MAVQKDKDDAGCPSVWYSNVRIGMIIVWLLLSCLDIWIWRQNQAPAWSAIVLLITNVWGWLDAVLRYPILHDVDSLFTLKNLLLILLKIGWLIWVFTRNKAYPISFVVCSMLAIIVPMFYAMFLPLDESEQAYNLIKSTYSDDDLAKRLWHFASNPRESVRAFNRMRYKAMKRGMEELAERSPSVAAKLGDMSPSRKAMLRKPGRSV